MALTEGQRQCVETLDRPLVVAAGAGSGKTFTLTKRIVGALQEGFVNDIDQVCAITFTKKAAAELKSRIKSELRACGLIDQALKVDEAWVSTIHGMCARILRSHAIELNIGPTFTVAEGAAIQDYLERAVDATLTRAQLDASESASGDAGDWRSRVDALFQEYNARSSGYGVSVEGMLLDIVTAASAQPDGVDGVVMPGVTLQPHLALSGGIAVIEELLDLAQGEKANKSRDEWIAVTQEQLAHAHEVLDCGCESGLEALEALTPFKLSKRFGGADYKARVDEAKGEICACVMELRLGCARPHLETLVELARMALDEFKSLKRADGALDNNDLLVMAALAIEEHPAIRMRYADKFKLVMVDEFQDTDQLQVDMIRRLAGEDGERLCVVGDEQQSIYRFRGADVSVYRRHLSSVRERRDDSVIKLAKNFRSHSDVLAFVDRVFQRPSMFGGGYMSLSAGRAEDRVKEPFEDERPRVVVQHTTKPHAGVSSDEMCATAANRVAEYFAELAAAGHSPGEMVILLGRMTRADVFAQALRAQGLPCVISGGSVFAGSLEVDIVRNLVRVIANPNETESLFNVLTSPLFALTADDLLTVGSLKGFWGSREDSTADEATTYGDQLNLALQVLGRMRRRVGVDSVARIVEDAIVESGWLSRLQDSGAEGLASAGNVFKAIRMIGDIEKSGAYGPVSVMRHFEETLVNSKEAPGALSVSGGDSVRIMTIHASKGLEFPIVAVAEMKEDRASSPALYVSTVGGRVYVSLDLGSSAPGSMSSADLDTMRDYVLGDVAGEDDLAGVVACDEGALHRRLALRDYATTGDAEEAKRLLYVALTRAKEALVVVTMGTRTKKDETGIPKNAFAGMFEALEAGGACLSAGIDSADYGGTHSAVFDCVALSPADADEIVDGQDASGEDTVEPSEDEALFPVPVFEPQAPLVHEVYRPLHRDVFSYSSISDSSHESDVLDRLAGAFSVSVDEALEDDDSFFDSADAHLKQPQPTEDDFWDVDVSQAFDEDRATDLGTAFHRLAQYAVVSRSPGDQLAAPPDNRITALARTCNLAGDQMRRLRDALARWFHSDLAHEMAAYDSLQAEVPFFVTVPDSEGNHVYLEGEIDLLGLDEHAAHARVVDYKTGGHAGETADDLRKKHVLQATCYAYSLLLQGVQTVRADFVRVEQRRADDPQQPQCVTYRFEGRDLPALEQAIAEAYRLADEHRVAE